MLTPGYLQIKGFTPATQNNNFKKSYRKNKLTSLHLVRVMKAELLSVPLLGAV